MLKLKEKLGYFSKGEIALWCASAALVVLSFCIFDREKHLTLIASLIGVTSLIFNAKGNPIGQFLMVIFSLLYGVISFTFAYYGEMITYLGMNAYGDFGTYRVVEKPLQWQQGRGQGKQYS